MDNFIHAFEYFSSQNLDDENLESIFKNGLKQELRAIIRMLKSKGLPGMIATTLEMKASIISIMMGCAIVQEYGEVKPSIPLNLEQLACHHHTVVGKENLKWWIIFTVESNIWVNLNLVMDRPPQKERESQIQSMRRRRKKMIMF